MSEFITLYHKIVIFEKIDLRLRVGECGKTLTVTTTAEITSTIIIKEQTQHHQQQQKQIKLTLDSYATTTVLLTTAKTTYCKSTAKNISTTAKQWQL